MMNVQAKAAPSDMVKERAKTRLYDRGMRGGSGKGGSLHPY